MCDFILVLHLAARVCVSCVLPLPGAEQSRTNLRHGHSGAVDAH